MSEWQFETHTTSYYFEKKWGTCLGRRVQYEEKTYRETRQILPHPQSISSFKKMWKRMKHAVETVEYGPLMNCTIDPKHGMRVNHRYRQAMEQLKAFNRRNNLDKIEDTGLI